MLLVADVGNTNTKIGVFDGSRLLASWRLTSRREQTADEYGLFIGTLLQTRGIRAADILAIAPGLATSVEALVTRAARLARVELARPKEAIGRNTTTNLQSGAIYGYAGLVDGLVDRMRGEMGGTAHVIATGGNAGLVVEVARSIEKVDEHLRLDGLRMLYADAHPSDGGVDTG